MIVKILSVIVFLATVYMMGYFKGVAKGTRSTVGVYVLNKDRVAIKKSTPN